MISFGERVEMMVDKYLIQSTENVTFRKNEPIDHGKVIGFDAPWEQTGSLGTSVLYDGEKIMCYYRGFPATDDDSDEHQTACLSTSSDGIHFTPYPANIIEYDGNKENNIVLMETICHNFSPFYDTNPDCKEDERYKAIGGIGGTGLHVFASPDGIHWKRLVDGPVMTKGTFDSINIAFWNPHTKLYHCYSRYFHIFHRLDFALTNNMFHGEYIGSRAIQSCTSTDFIHWTDPVPNEYVDGIVENLYTNATTPVPGAEHIMVSFPMRYHDFRKKMTEADGYTKSGGLSDAILMTSRNGIHWDRTLSDAWVAGSLYSHEWTQRNFITLRGIIEQGNDFYIYTTKNYDWDDDGIFLYSIPRYRFLSLYADGKGGSFTTKELSFTTDTIHLNYSTSAFGSVVVQVLNLDGTIRYTSKEIYGNELSYPLTIPNLAGTEGMLRFTLKEAHIYAIGSNMAKKHVN